MGIGKVNTGGGGSGGTLVVTAPAGVTVFATKDDKTYTRTANAEGVATFKGLSSGTWMLSIADAEHEPSTPAPVVVKADYTVALSFFAATINVTYPSGSQLTCTNGTTELTATTNTGNYVFTVPNAGTWRVECVSGSNRNYKDVSITSNGQINNVTLSYIMYLYNRGDLCESNSGGWGGSSANVKFNEDHIHIAGQNDHMAFTHNNANLPSGYSKLVVVGEVVQQTNFVCFQNCGLVSTSDLFNGDVAAMWHHHEDGPFTKTIDISSVSDIEQRVVKLSVGMSPWCVGKIHEVYLTS